MDVKSLVADVRVRVAVLTLACFLLSSTGWLLWLYHLASIASPGAVDVLTMGVGYLMQALGIGAFVCLERNHGSGYRRRAVTAVVLAYVVCLLPATLTNDLAPVLAFGYLANLLCGYLQGYYLYCLARNVSKQNRGVVFGSAYAISTGLSWILSVIAEGALTRGVPGLVTCFLLAVPTVLLARMPLAELAPRSELSEHVDGTTLVMVCSAVALMSLTKGAGFSFPTVDLLKGVSLEMSRLLYGVGLLAAGIVSDRDRRLGALCCAGALVMPFLMLALTGAAAPATIMWALGYLLNGFFSVFRVVLLADLAAERKQPLLAGLGLLLGRVGDALGTVISLVLVGSPLVLITAVSALFACTIALFFVLYQRLFGNTAEPAPTEREIFEDFAARHDLSQREREVLRLLLAERTNSEIAGELYVSEATVKYHVRNLLRKTGCRTRLEILALYGGARS